LQKIHFVDANNLPAAIANGQKLPIIDTLDMHKPTNPKKTEDEFELEALLDVVEIEKQRIWELEDTETLELIGDEEEEMEKFREEASYLPPITEEIDEFINSFLL